MEVTDRHPYLIQGAHPPELDVIRNSLSHSVEVTVASFLFWKGNIQTSDGMTIPVVVSVTGIGSALAAAATAIAIQHFDPIAVINQGIAGGHAPTVQVGDVIVGDYCVNLNSFKTPFRAEKEGSDPLQWKPKRNRGIGGGHEDINDLSYIDNRKIFADSNLREACQHVVHSTSEKVHFGGVGSSETWNSELDRIHYLHEMFGTLCEEMEAAAIAQICDLSDVPFISIRAISNNITNNGVYNLCAAEACQRFVMQLVNRCSRSDNCQYS
mmetsp:Transcript_6554/g.12579  ORF Transcript_6554/g.12579 Transcript_6554/m.12579 type:complete len:268 (+) Transcript_6554:57-860(+)